MYSLSFPALSNVVLTNKYLVPVSPEPMLICAVFVCTSSAGSGVSWIISPPTNWLLLVDKYYVYVLSLSLISASGFVPLYNGSLYVIVTSMFFTTFSLSPFAGFVSGVTVTIGAVLSK